jgi:hypothetical protein
MKGLKVINLDGLEAELAALGYSITELTKQEN